MARSESISTQASSSSSTRPQRIRKSTANATNTDLIAIKPKALKAKKRPSSELGDTEVVISSASTRQTNKKRRLSSERTGMSSVATSSPVETVQGSASTSSNPNLRQSPEVPENTAQVTVQLSSSPSQEAEKPKPKGRIKSYDAALEKAITRADDAEKRASEAERRLHELEQDKLAASYENYKRPTMLKFNTLFDIKDQRIRDLEARIEKHEITIAKKKGEVYSHIADRKRMKASLAEKDKDIKVLKDRQEELTAAVITRNAQIVEKNKTIAELEEQLEKSHAEVAEKREESENAEAIQDGCDEALDNMDAEILSLKAELRTHKSSLVQKVRLLRNVPCVFGTAFWSYMLQKKKRPHFFNKCPKKQC